VVWYYSNAAQVSNATAPITTRVILSARAMGDPTTSAVLPGHMLKRSLLVRSEAGPASAGKRGGSGLAVPTARPSGARKKPKIDPCNDNQFQDVSTMSAHANEYGLTLCQADHARSDFAAIADDLEFITADWRKCRPGGIFSGSRLPTSWERRFSQFW